MKMFFWGVLTIASITAFADQYEKESLTKLAVGRTCAEASSTAINILIMEKIDAFKLGKIMSSDFKVLEEHSFVYTTNGVITPACEVEVQWNYSIYKDQVDETGLILKAIEL